jgi:hypothetical protein
LLHTARDLLRRGALLLDRAGDRRRRLVDLGDGRADLADLGDAFLGRELNGADLPGDLLGRARRLIG